MLFRATASTARGKFAVNHNGGYTANAVVLGLGSCLGLLHVVDYDFMRKAGKPLDQFDGTIEVGILLPYDMQKFAR